ncbi:hypothetical protein NPIL_639391 [Nephila pilipes]|uniref:Uncharacterized protein n=1 Tax=Nephila pilipes TaxID=299642 RepID=A0A8X6UBF6_NEPPI|nr:hypothetical protein NPIL_639391 [Nephila pilipes]
MLHPKKGPGGVYYINNRINNEVIFAVTKLKKSDGFFSYPCGYNEINVSKSARGVETSMAECNLVGFAVSKVELYETELKGHLGLMDEDSQRLLTVYTDVFCFWGSA